MSAPAASPAVCPDCRWIETRVALDGGMNFACAKGRAIEGEFLARGACSDFAPDPELRTLPREAPRAPRRARPAAPSGPLIQPPDPDGLREAMRDGREVRPVPRLMGEHEAVRRFVRDGDYLAFDLYGTVRCPLSIVRETVRQGRKGLRLAGQGTMEIDLLIAAGLVSALDLTYVGYEAHGLSPVLRRAVEAGTLELAEWSNAALSWRFKAAAMGVPFLPARSMLGSDTLARSAARTMTDPFTGKPVVLLPALSPDCAVLHVHRADVTGNCQIDGVSGFARELARAAKRVIVTAETIVGEEEIRAHPERTVIPYWCVDAVVPAPFGAHPGETNGVYRRDEDLIREFLEAARTPEGTRGYLERWVSGPRDHEAYLDRVGRERLEYLRV